VAGLYRDVVHGFVLDERDAGQAADVEALGLRALVVDTIMRDVDASARLAEATLSLAASLR
jgi:LPPG:FO 2-phospho-L-lactate transferase